MQAQDYRAMRWAVAMRTRNPSYKAFKAVFDEGRILRAHLLRGTWQLVSAEDYHWLRTLCHDKGMAVLDGWTKSLGFTYSGKEKERILTIIEDSVASMGEVTEDVIGEALLDGGIPKDRLVYNHQLRLAELEGLVCSGSLGPRNTYRLVLTGQQGGIPYPSGKEIFSEPWTGYTRGLCVVERAQCGRMPAGNRIAR